MAFRLKYIYGGREPAFVSLDRLTPLKIGRLLSNDVIIALSSVEPIHALIEPDGDKYWRITALSPNAGIQVDGKKISVESTITIGSIISIAGATIELEEVEDTALRAPMQFQENEQAPNYSRARILIEKTRQTLLFSPRSAKPGGETLEVVAYWGNTILEVEHFHRAEKGFNKVTIGDPVHAHFIAAGPTNLVLHELATVRDDSYKLNLVPGMHARLRKGGAVEEVEGGSHKLGKRDIAHVTFGSVHYFFLFVNPPSVQLPRMGPKDPFFVMLTWIFMTFFMVSSTALWLANPEEKKPLDEDLWAIVHTVKEEKKEEKKKEVEEVKPEVKIAEVKKPPPEIKPPPPEPKKVEPVKVEEKEKPKEQPKQEKKPEQVKTLIKQVEPPKVEKAEKDQAAKGDNAKGGALGGGAALAGAPIKGKSQSNAKGVEGAKTPKASGVNLSKLGLGVGKISSADGPSAIHTNFKSSAGGAGAGMGSGDKTLGLGGVDSSARSLALTGTGKAADNFGSGQGGVIGGNGKQGNAFGTGRKPTAVNVGTGDPLISGGLSDSEIMGVIRANLNQVRYCYDTLLQRSPNAAGVMKVQFMIGLDGYVSSAQMVNSNINDGVMQGCVLSVIKRWKFNTPRGSAPVKVTYPFSFNSV